MVNCKSPGEAKASENVCEINIKVIRCSAASCQSQMKHEYDQRVSHVQEDRSLAKLTSFIIKLSLKLLQKLLRKHRKINLKI